MSRPDYCPIGGEPCQSLCVEPCRRRKPLSDAQANEIARASFEKFCGRPHPWEGAQPWVIAAIKRAANGISGDPS